VQHAGLARPDLAEVVAAPGQLGADGAQDPGPFGMSQPRPGAAVERLRAASTALDMSAACASATLKKSSSVPESTTLMVASDEG